MPKTFAIMLFAIILLGAIGAGIFFSSNVLDAWNEATEAAALMNRARYEQEFSDQPRAQFAALNAEMANSNLLTIRRNTPIFANRHDEEPMGFLPPQVVQITAESGNWLRIRNWQGEKWMNTDWLPDYILLEVPTFNQQALGMPTGCEIVAIAMLINHRVDVDVMHLVEQMPRSYDPLLGFRGNPFTRGGFTILPPALLELTEEHMGNAIDMTGASIEEVQARLILGRPVVVWVGRMFGFNVHAITLTGFNEEGFFYNDPWLGGTNVFITYDAFLDMWEYPIRDFRLNRVYPVRMALSY